METSNAGSAPGVTASGKSDEEASSLDELLDQIDGAADEKDETSVGDILDAVGRRSFAPLLLFAGLVILAPIVGDIPGVPVMMGLIVFLTAGQMILKRPHIWLPEWLRNRAVSNGKVKKAIKWMRKPARFADRWSKHRYEWIVTQAGAYLIALLCLTISLITPILELIPFSANLAGIAITAFGLALIRTDGLIAIVAVLFSGTAIGLVLYQLI